LNDHVYDYLRSLFLGVVEGLTEFLPVSSTAHLRIGEALLRLDLADPYWKTYTIVIQLGAILSLPLYFRARIAGLLGAPPVPGRSRLRSPIALVMIAFVTTAGPAFLLTKLIKKHLESLTVMGLAMLIGGIVMWVVDALKARWEKAGPEAPGNPIRTWKMDDMTLGQAVWIGACQILSALFPGTSRSMSTIVGGQLAGMSRAAALEFSFFLSMPTMAAATGYDLLKSLVGRDATHVDFTPHRWAVLAIGLVVSFVVAYGSVAVLMAWVRRRGFAPFAVYRIVVGLAVLAWAMSIR
jgi:undecaprenyl-diphosphatase